MSETQLDSVATLSGGAAKLLLHLLQRGGRWGGMAEMMAGAGISKPTYLSAKRELRDKELDQFYQMARFSILTPQDKELALPGQEALPQVREVDQQGQEMLPGQVKEDALQRYEREHGYPYGFTPRQWQDYNQPEAQVPAPERNFAEVSEETARQQCAAADRLPGGGDPLRPTSEFQARRQAQVKALCMTWGEMFPTQTPLTALAAKQLLQAGNNCAEDVYDALDAAKNRGVEWPAAYAKKVLSDTPKAAPATPHPSGSPAAPENHQGEMLEWTPEWEARVRRGEEKLRKLGYGHLLGGDEG